jgi:very-short-patch-repair endonuclease
MKVPLPQASFTASKLRTVLTQTHSMNNIVYRQEFIAAGVASRTIKRALNCCLLRLGAGVYSIVRDCRAPSHRRIAAFIDDFDWIDFHVGKTAADLASDFQYQDLLRSLTINSYRRYRADDTISGTSAAILHGIPLYKEPKGPITVIHPRSNSSSKQIVRTLRTIDDEDRVVLGHLRATSAIRTGLDLIGLRGQQAAFAGMEWVLRQSVIRAAPGFNPRFGYTQGFRDLGRRHIEEYFLPAVGRLKTGHVTAQNMAESLSAVSESIAESYCSLNLKALRLTGFEQQVNIDDARGFIARVDFLHEATRTIVAVDGSGKYALMGPALLRSEGEQQNRLLGLGYRIIHFTFSELLHLNDFSAKLFEQSPELRNFAGARR